MGTKSYRPKVGMKVKFVGDNNFARNGNEPRLIEGVSYEITRVVTHSWHTRIWLKEAEHMGGFNSAMFEVADEGE